MLAIATIGSDNDLWNWANKVGSSFLLPFYSIFLFYFFFVKQGEDEETTALLVIATYSSGEMRFKNKVSLILLLFS